MSAQKRLYRRSWPITRNDYAISGIPQLWKPIWSRLDMTLDELINMYGTTFDETEDDDRFQKYYMTRAELDKELDEIANRIRAQ